MPDEAETASLGYLLVGHGTRKPAGADQLRRVYQQFAPRVAPNPSAYCFLELAEPQIGQVVAEMAARGVKRLVTVPLLLFTAGHAEHDIPSAVNAAAARCGIVVQKQTHSLGCSPAMLRLSAQRFQEAVCGVCAAAEDSPLGKDASDRNAAMGPAVMQANVVQSLPACTVDRCGGKYCDRAGLVMIGRGSSSQSATEEMRRFAALRRELTPVGWQETAFIHAQRPAVLQALDALEDSGMPLAVVQPHLLFEGLLMDEIREQVAVRQQRAVNQTWVLTDTLGVDHSLAVALSELAVG